MRRSVAAVVAGGLAATMLVLPGAASATIDPGWSGWQALGGPIVGGPDLASWGPGHVDMFATGTDGRLHHRGFPTSTGGWSPYDDLGPVWSAPAAVSTGGGRVAVFAATAGGELQQRSYDSGSGWSPWQVIPGPVIGAPDATTSGGGRIDLVARNGLGQVIYNAFRPPLGWTGWVPLGGSATSDPSVVSWGNGRLDVFVRGAANDLQHRSFDPASGWSDWESLGGGLGSAPDAAAWGPGRIDVFVRNATTALYQRSYQDGAGWGGWRRLSGMVTADPGAVATGPGKIALAVRSTGDAVYQQSFGSSAPAPVPVPVTRSRIVSLAQSRLGTPETPAGSNCTPFEPSGVCLPWCLYFATWAWHSANGLLPYLSFTGTLVNWAIGNGRWRPGTRAAPAPGDIVVYGWTAARSVHAGVVESVLPDGRITTIDGNWGDRVQRVGPYDPTRATAYGMPAPVLGYASPLPLTGGLTASARSTYHPPAPTLAQIRSQDGGH